MDRILIFDFDGVLADSLLPMLGYAEQVCRELGISYTPTKADLEALEHMEFSEFGRQLGVPEDQIEIFVSRNFELFTQRKESLQITPGMDSVVRVLSQFCSLGIITGNSCVVVEKFLTVYGLRNLFQNVLCAEHEGNRLEKILKIKTHTSTPNGEIYMIGDAVSDIRAARKAGVKSIAVSWGHQSKHKLTLEAPDLIIDEPQDLLTNFSKGGWELNLQLGDG